MHVLCSQSLTYVGSSPSSTAITSGPAQGAAAYNPTFTFEASPGAVGTPIIATQCLVSPSAAGPAPAEVSTCVTSQVHWPGPAIALEVHRPGLLHAG